MPSTYEKEDFYSVYLSHYVVEIHQGLGFYAGQGRFICRQKNYESLLRFATNLAKTKKLALHNYVQIEGAA